MLISGDNPLNLKEKIVYLFGNFLKGVIGSFTFLPTIYWKVKKISGDPVSPYRSYVNDFLLNQLNQIKKKLGENLKILEIGCGTGSLYTLIHKSGFIGDYYGVDIKKFKQLDNLEKNNLRFNFFSKLEDIDNKTKMDVVFSITTLEHVAEDKLMLQKTIQISKSGGIHIHIVPSFWSLFLFLFHGYRQYNRSMIKQLFKDYNYTVYRFGGIFSFFLHLFFITIPFRLFGINLPEKIRSYRLLVKLCNFFDNFFPFFSATYAVVVTVK